MRFAQERSSQAIMQTAACTEPVQQGAAKKGKPTTRHSTRRRQEWDNDSPLGEQLLGCGALGGVFIQAAGDHLTHAAAKVAPPALRLELRRRAL